MKLISVVGARPNFMKIAPLARAIRAHNEGAAAETRIDHLLVHTGQHYDDRMSATFFEQLGIPHPDIDLGVGSGSHAEQVGRTMIAFEKVVRSHRPDWVVVVGDVNATCACSITAKKENVLLAHIEAGLRSRDMRMPEEVNRLVTDRLSDLLFTPDRISSDNLRGEGVAETRIRFVGNIMIDTLEHERATAERIDIADLMRRNRLAANSDGSEQLRTGDYAVVTLHRPSNVDQGDILRPLVDFLVEEVAREMPVIWPLHPRTRRQLAIHGLERKLDNRGLYPLHPVNYHDMLKLNMDAAIMLTDSGGLQEECCVLGTPCLTLRENTERPITLRENGGASVIVGNDVRRVREAYRMALDMQREPTRPELWDGRAAQRIGDGLLGRRDGRDGTEGLRD